MGAALEVDIHVGACERRPVELLLVKRHIVQLEADFVAALPSQKVRA